MYELYTDGENNFGATKMWNKCEIFRLFSIVPCNFIALNIL